MIGTSLVRESVHNASSNSKPSNPGIITPLRIRSGARLLLQVRSKVLDEELYGTTCHNCPGVDSKSRTLMLRMADRLPQDWEIDYEDLGNVYARAHIQSCNACASTSMALSAISDR